MAAGADMASVSMHKSGGSLTQSSLLLIGPNVHPGYVRQIINLTQTTSGSYLLMSSLDISRRNLALRGRQVFHQVADIAEYAREEINAVGGYYALARSCATAILFLTLTPPSSASIRWILVLPASRSTTSCGTSMTFRSSSAISATSLPTCPSATARRRWSVWSVRWPRSSAATAPMARVC